MGPARQDCVNITRCLLLNTSGVFDLLCTHTIEQIGGRLIHTCMGPPFREQEFRRIRSLILCESYMVSTQFSKKFIIGTDSVLIISFIISFLKLIPTTIKPIYKQLNAFRANWLALTW